MSVKRTPDWGTIANIASVSVAVVAFIVAMQDKGEAHERKQDNRLRDLEWCASVKEACVRIKPEGVAQ